MMSSKDRELVVKTEKHELPPRNHRHGELTKTSFPLFSSQKDKCVQSRDAASERLVFNKWRRTHAYDVARLAVWTKSTPVKTRIMAAIFVVVSVSPRNMLARIPV